MMVIKTILVDCTTASPLAKDIKLKDYKAGKAADGAVNRKIKDYKRYFKIDDNQRSNIFFFAVETSGGLSYEARKYVKLLAKISNSPMGWAIQRISTKS